MAESPRERAKVEAAQAAQTHAPVTSSGIPVKPVYTPADAAYEYARDLGVPG
ncbi:MAG: hypothetical protein HY702_02610, partial [Gemmatimonadetes bacterium]|nr:hypothetical protein [Gemmatimonadota bacterium]